MVDISWKNIGSFRDRWKFPCQRPEIEHTRTESRPAVVAAMAGSQTENTWWQGLQMIYSLTYCTDLILYMRGLWRMSYCLPHFSWPFFLFLFGFNHLEPKLHISPLHQCHHVSFRLRLRIFAEIGLLLLGAMVLKARRKRGRVCRALGNPRRQYVWEETVGLFLSERRPKKVVFVCVIPGLSAFLSYFVLCDVQQKAESFPSKLLIWSFHIFLKVLWKHLPLLQRHRF